ncbi:MAG: FKBP-type peptidyl-prolyl cis-trans isomerase [Candidatus Methanodesulfokora sp.]|nr:MAG: peptidylprolyl isomerase [Candidatus Korarchaeota archaeon]
MAEKQFAWVNLTFRDAQTGKVYETTDEEVARKEGIYDENYSYEPVLLIPGESGLRKVELFVEENEEGAKATIELLPEEAFGQYDPSKVRVFSAKRLEKEGIKDVKKGDVLRMNGERGTVISVDGGRVRVDFNHPLAGKRLLVDVHIVKKVKNKEDIVKALLIRSFDIPFDAEVEVKMVENEVEINLPSIAYTKKDATARKLRFLSDIMKYTDIKKVVFKEEHVLPRD